MPHHRLCFDFDGASALHRRVPAFESAVCFNLLWRPPKRPHPHPPFSKTYPFMPHPAFLRALSFSAKHKKKKKKFFCFFCWHVRAPNLLATNRLCLFSIRASLLVTVAAVAVAVSVSVDVGSSQFNFSYVHRAGQKKQKTKKSFSNSHLYLI